MVGIIAIKTERTQIHFLSDVLVAVASLDLKVPIIYQGERLVTPPSPIFYKRDALLSDVWFPIRTRAVQTKIMWNSDLHYNLIQKGAVKYEDSEESEESEVSSQGTESSQEETESLEPWSRIFDEAEKRHETQLNALISEYEGNGDSENVARVKAENALLPVYRKEQRKVLLENLQWMHAIKKDPTFKKVMETQKELKDTEGFDWLESTELAIDKRKFLLN